MVPHWLLGPDVDCAHPCCKSRLDCVPIELGSCSVRSLNDLMNRRTEKDRFGSYANVDNFHEPSFPEDDKQAAERRWGASSLAQDFW